MPVSPLPTISGLTLPEGCTNVKVADKRGANAAIDVTVLGDTERTYRQAILLDEDELTVTASFFSDSPPTVSPVNVTSGWVCTDVEIDYAVGEFVKGTATYVFR